MPISSLIQHRNNIISTLYTSTDFNQCINKMEPEHLRDDLRNEVMLVLCEKDPAVIVGLEERNELRWYVVRIILNMVKSNSSPFVKTYRRLTTNRIPEEIPVKELNGRVVRECQEEAVLRFIRTELYWYDREIIKMYMQLGSYRAIQDETYISKCAAWGTVQNAIKKIRKEVLNVTE